MSISREFLGQFQKFKDYLGEHVKMRLASLVISQSPRQKICSNTNIDLVESCIWKRYVTCPQSKLWGYRRFCRPVWDAPGLVRIILMCSSRWFLNFWNWPINIRDTDTNARRGKFGALLLNPVFSVPSNKQTQTPLYSPFSDQVDDFSFLPFAQDLLVTCSRDEKVPLPSFFSKVEVIFS